MAPHDLNVLIVDDHEPMRVLLVRMLERAGVAHVRAASSGAEALTMLTDAPADLVLADQNMPGMDGLTFVAAVRANPALGAPRIIVVSGEESADHRDAARAAGADETLTKPVAPRSLLEAINALFAI